MKYLMGLIISFTIGASAIAQNTVNITSGSEGGSKKARCERGDNKNKIKMETGSSLKSSSTYSSTSSNQSYSGMSTEEQMVIGDVPTTVRLNPGLDVTYGFENGSVQYSKNPLKNPSQGAMTSVNSSAKKGSTSKLKSNFGTQCDINDILDSKEGAFKDKMDYADGRLEVKKEKSGEAKVEFKSNDEYYLYERKKDGRDQLVHNLQRGDNEVIELQKNKDGSASIYYEGSFDNIDQANQALNGGLMFEDVTSACVK